MDDGELLQRLSATLRADVGPAVDDEYTRTQAFMASVILEKVGRQLSLAPAHTAAERADLDALWPDLDEVLAGADSPPELAAAVDQARADGTVMGLGPVVAALYAWGPAGHPAAAAALARIRPVLRADIDRRMEIAR